ncbi:MoeB/ThiF family adenylyltransferase [Bacillus sp. SJS]|uniref:MoeB/ThiF family adenylyltransferase n=1 Tax=Bacillus sp. SJS TaxID=1423321 RepID=UPI0004DD072B|nr:MoeB/ThiF family adenylyltransferase [Bacillus sp. SJS]KZZ82656.1 thiamine biosynthesis protein MoeB [Bacillus sp. SJS]
MDDRYSRQHLFAPIGKHGQDQISSKHVLIVGTGALGSAAAEMLARAGIGKLTLIDRDYVEWSNLQRQQLYEEKDAREKMPKALAAKNRLARINTDVHVEAYVEDAAPGNLEPLLHDIDLIIDAADNFDIRFVLNDLSHKFRIPWIYGSCVGSYGVTCTILPGKTPCLKCLLERMPPSGATCDTVGIISPAVQITAAYQTAEAMKILVEDMDHLRETFISFDLWNNQHFSIKFDKVKKENCPTCGSNPSYPHLKFENQTKSELLCGRNTVQIRPPEPIYHNLDELEKRLSVHGKIERNPFLLSCTLQGHRLVIFQDGRVFIHGTNSIQEAKKLYYQILG